MAKFKYYVTNLFSGDIEGTNSDDKAKELAQCDEFYVVNAETGLWLAWDDGEIEVKEIEG